MMSICLYDSYDMVATAIYSYSYSDSYSYGSYFHGNLSVLSSGTSLDNRSTNCTLPKASAELRCCGKRDPEKNKKITFGF